MGNQITFTPKEKDKTISGADGELEMENIQLRNTNRKLISKLDQQKQLIKRLNNELESIKMSVELNDANRLNRRIQTLKKKNENLETLLSQSKKEVANLKLELNKLNKDSEESKSNSPWNKLKKIRK